MVRGLLGLRGSLLSSPPFPWPPFSGFTSRSSSSLLSTNTQTQKVVNTSWRRNEGEIKEMSSYPSQTSLDWWSAVSLSLSRSRFCTAAVLPSEQTHLLYTTVCHTHSSRNTPDDTHSPGHASQTQWARSSPDTHCIWWQITWKHREKKNNECYSKRGGFLYFVITSCTFGIFTL